MINPENRIIEFLNEHHVLTMATLINNQTWCSNMFYVFIEKDMKFLFTSDENTNHINHILNNPDVSGTVVLETKTVGKIRGVQFTGAVSKVKSSDFLKYKLIYLKKFPYAILKNTKLWLLNIESIKMTDNRLGFGKKVYWNRD